MTLYHVNWCPECQVVRAKLDKLAIKYESVTVPDRHSQRTQVFEVSGQYYVPVVKDGDTVLTETDDIISYLESKYGRKTAQS